MTPDEAGLVIETALLSELIGPPQTPIHSRSAGIWMKGRLVTEEPVAMDVRFSGYGKPSHGACWCLIALGRDPAGRWYYASAASLRPKYWFSFDELIARLRDPEFRTRHKLPALP